MTSREREVHVGRVRSRGAGAPSVGVQFASCVCDMRRVIATQGVPAVEYGCEPCRVHERGVLLVICTEATLSECAGGGTALCRECLQLWELPYRAMFVADEK